MKKIVLTLKLNIFPRIRNMLHALVRRPSQINISPSEIISLFGPEKIDSFVSIGANDGVKNDHLASFITKYKWHGIMIEPMPDNFTRLKKHFGDNKNIVLENMGVSEKNDISDFYYIKDIAPDEPDWYDQVGSFDRDVFYKNISVEPSLLNRVGVEKIQTSTLDEITRKHGFGKIDLVMIDTEGYDYKILKSLDLDKINAEIIIFEYEWLTNYETKQAIKMLVHAGYRTIINGIDCIAIK